MRKDETFDAAFADALRKFPQSVFEHELIGAVYPTNVWPERKPSAQAEQALAEMSGAEM